MNNKKTLPLEGKAIRFAPSRNQEPAVSLWKVWAEGSEVYASSRSPQGSMKISVHASGQVHYRLEAKLKQDLAPDAQGAATSGLRAVISLSGHIPCSALDTLNRLPGLPPATASAALL